VVWGAVFVYGGGRTRGVVAGTQLLSAVIGARQVGRQKRLGDLRGRIAGLRKEAVGNIGARSGVCGAPESAGLGRIIRRNRDGEFVGSGPPSQEGPGSPGTDQGPHGQTPLGRASRATDFQML